MALAAFTRLDYVPGFTFSSPHITCTRLKLCEWWSGAQNQDWEQRNLDSPPRFNTPPRFKASSSYLPTPRLARSNINLILSYLPTPWTLVKLWASQRNMQQEMHFSLKEINGKLKLPIFRMCHYLRYFGSDFCDASRQLKLHMKTHDIFRSD